MFTIVIGQTPYFSNLRSRFEQRSHVCGNVGPEKVLLGPNVSMNSEIGKLVYEISTGVISLELQHAVRAEIGYTKVFD